MTEVVARNASEWQAWLDAHHETAAEAWLVYWKKGSGRESIDWAQAVEVALRFGWIDGIIRSIDGERYKQRFTPRRAKSKWSKVNREIALRLIAAGEMRPMGSPPSRPRSRAASGIAPTPPRRRCGRPPICGRRSTRARRPSARGSG